ncbi:MAG: response regulator, partial [Planctomycetes bacterium]|nr:response regulator [Planctomycetota bacterium]
EQREYAETILSSARALLNIINDILDISKIEAGKLELSHTAFDLHKTLEEIAGLLAQEAHEKGIELIFRFDPEAPRNLIGDQIRIRQVLTNLVGNAVKFTNTGHVLIDLECIEKTGRNACLRFSVEDTGIGIPSDQLSKIFEKFSQADNSSTRRFCGTGLGLAISKELVELMGGAIRAESRLDEGSVFWFELIMPEDKNANRPSISLGDFEGRSVLIVDESEIYHRIFHERLERWGLEIETCKSSMDAIDRLHCARERGQTYSWILIDHAVNYKETESLASRIKKDINIDIAPLIILIPQGKQDLAERSRKDGFVSFIYKPIHEKQMRQSLSFAGKLSSSVATIGKGETKRFEKKLPEKQTGKSDTRETYEASVLLVEDNLINQKVAVKMLQKNGCTVDVAMNGKEGLRKYEDNQYDIIFMDCQMPEMDGYEATNLIRVREEGRQRTPIIALTANAMQGDREKCLEAGMDGYLTKPVKQKELMEILKKYSGGKIRLIASKEQRVLVVDDDQEFLKYIKRVFKRNLPMVSLKTAAGGMEAIALLGSYLPDVIVLDLNMPGMNGGEFLNFLRSNDRYSKIDVIIITGLSERSEEVIQIRSQEVGNILFKPFTDEELFGRINGLAIMKDNESCNEEIEKLVPVPS